MNTTNLNNSGKWCFKCEKPILDEIFIDIKSNCNVIIYENKITEMLSLCSDCQANKYKMEVLRNEIADKKQLMQTLKRETLYHKELLKNLNESLLSLEWQDFETFQD
jgi:hypothetical protein